MVGVSRLLRKDHLVDRLLIPIQVCNQHCRMNGYHILRDGIRQNNSGVGKRLVDEFDVVTAFEETLGGTDDRFESG